MARLLYLVVIAKFKYSCYELFPHLPCPLDVAPSDFFLFPNSTKCHGRNIFESNDEIIVQMNAYFEDLYKDYLKVVKNWRYVGRCVWSSNEKNFIIRILCFIQKVTDYSTSPVIKDCLPMISIILR